MAAELGSLPAETLVCEDALYAAAAAKQAGFRVCAIRDGSEPRQSELEQIADRYLTTWLDCPPSLLD